MATSIATNTLIIPNIPRCFFNSQETLKTIRQQWEAYGSLCQFIPMKGFLRLMIIYMETQCAIAAKAAMDRTTLYWTIDEQQLVDIQGLSHDNIDKNQNDSLHTMEVRVYFGQHNPINPDPTKSSLQVPQPGRNLLISPPGSPCEEWKQREESPPNKAVLASDLLRALIIVDDENELDIEDSASIDNFRLDDNEDPPTNYNNNNNNNNNTDYEEVDNNHSNILKKRTDSLDSNTSPLCTPTLQITFDHSSLPTIMIEDMDGSVLTQHQEKLNKSKMSATARPPILF